MRRHWLVPAIALLLTAGRAGGQVSVAPLPVVELAGVSVERDLLIFLATLQLELRSEAALCLTMGEDSVIRGVRAAHVLRRDSIGVRFSCWDPNLKGLWHMHPAPHDECEFSPKDQVAFRRSDLDLSLLSCGRGEFRYMVRGVAEVIAFTVPQSPDSLKR